jgi:ABC-type nitrate/sulfonate/bicarbonate transport system substrate-binding protein
LALVLALFFGIELLFPVAGSPAEAVKIRVGTLRAPASISWLVAVMEEKKFDLKHGIDIEWIEQPSTAALYNDFAAGSYQVATGGVMTYANQYARGVKLNLFGVFQLFGTSVIVNTERASDIRSLKDLTGRELAAPLASENYRAMTVYMMWAGAEVKSLKTRNFEHPAVAAELRSPTGTAPAGIVWAELPTRLVMEDSKKFRDLVSVDELEALWRQRTGTEHHWLLGWAAQQEFARANQGVLQRLHNAMHEATQWFAKNPDESVKWVEKKTKVPRHVLLETIKAGRVKFDQRTVAQEEKSLQALFEISVDLGFVTKLPDAGFYYRGLR